MENRYIVKDIVRGQKELFDAGKLVWYVWDRRLEQLGLAYFLTQDAAQLVCDKKNRQEPAQIS